MSAWEVTARWVIPATLCATTELLVQPQEAYCGTWISMQ